ncbi:13660_t:CDS:2 [Gigaspora rosea]|nr:13660_t:CDS:2 [Gigaspora rosea]
MSIQNHKRQLLALGTIDQKLHYGPFASNWWFELNQKEFIIRVVDNNWKPGYVCELDTEAIVYLTSSAAINETYKKYFNIKTQFSGPSILGFDNKVVAEQLCAKILFFLFQITVYGITIFVVAFGSSDQAEWNFADWYQFFTKWKQQSTTIIEFSSHLASIYLADFVFTNTIVEVWRLIMQYVGCTNITPYKRKELDVKTIASITQLFYFEWPTDNDYSGYIQARCLPHIGPCTQFSPFEISKLTTIPINKPTPNITPYSTLKKPWIFPLSQVQDKNYN